MNLPQHNDGAAPSFSHNNLSKTKNMKTMIKIKATAALALLLIAGPALTQAPTNIAFAGAKASDASGTRVWMTTLSDEPLLDGKELHATMKKALTGALELRIAKHGLTLKEGAEVQFRLAEGSFDAFVKGIADHLTRINIGDASIVACQTGDGIFCPMPGEFYSHRVLKSDLILLYVSRGEKDRTAWLDASESERAILRSEVNQKLLELYAANAPEADEDTSNGEEQQSAGDAALNLAYVLTLPQTALRKLTPKALKEDIKEILSDPKGTLFGRGSKLDKNMHRIEEDFEEHWKSAFAGRGSSIDVVIHDVEEKGEKIAKELGRAADSVKADIKDIAHKPAEILKKPAREVKRAANKVKDKVKKAWKKVF